MAALRLHDLTLFVRNENEYYPPTSPAQSASLTLPKYRADIDGLRAIAVLSVVGFHAFPKWVASGFIGVDIFFVISGFLISTIIFGSLKANNFSFIEFYSRRIKRIFPALLLVLITSYAFGWFALLVDEYKQLGKHIAGGAGFVSNFVLWNERGYFDNTAATKPLLHLWSLGIEEQFYIVWPLLLWLAWRQRVNLLIITSVIGLISFALNTGTVRGDAVAAFYSPQTRFWELLVGSALAYTTLFKNALTNHKQKLANAQSFVGAALIVVSVLVITKERTFPGWWALLPTVGAALIISAGTQAWLNRAVLSNRILIWFGLISFPLYLWHWPLLSFARIIESESPSREIRIAAVVISIALAWLTYSLIEKPIRFGKHNKAKAIALVLSMIVVGFMGYDSYQLGGLEFRLSIHDLTLSPKVTNEFVGPLWKFTKNDLCLNRYPFKESAEYGWWFCMASKDERPTLVLLGNSFANQLYAGLANNGAIKHHSILSIGTCDPAKVDESQLTKEVDFNPCSGNRPLQQQKFIDHIIESSNSIRYVILDGLIRNPDSKYISRLKERIDLLERHNIKVIIFTPHIMVDYDIRGCFSRPFKPNSRNCELNLEARRKLTEDFKPLVDQLSKTNPNVAFFDQNDLFCNNVKCSMVHNGMPLFRDEYHHMSEYGSIEVSKIFTKWAGTNIPEIFR